MKSNRLTFGKSFLTGVLMQLILSGLLLFTAVDIGAEVDNGTYINANNILMFVGNRGAFARDLDAVFGYDYGTIYPFTSVDSVQSGAETNSPLYAGGLWLGGKVAGEIRVSVAEFSTEFWPGPMSGNSFESGADTVAAYRIYKLYSDSMSSNPNQDYTDWPIGQGAPLDDMSDPLLLGDQTLWSVYNDANPSSQIARLGNEAPLGIEIHQTTWAENHPDRSRVIYMKYKLYNNGGNNITDFHIGFWLDTDLGSTMDDLTGSDTLSDLFFCYNADNYDDVYGTSPPAVGARMMYGPVVASASDTAAFDLKPMPGFKNLEMSSYASYVNGTDPQNGQEVYNYLTGLKADGSPLANGTKFSWPGDPVAGTGDLETIPGNRHMVGSFGPITFNAGDSQFVMFKIAVGQDSDRLTSLTNLKDLLTAPDNFPTDVKDYDGRILPSGYALFQNFPNPFNPSTEILFNLPRRSLVSLSIFNLLGQQVRTLVSGELSAGQHRVGWDGNDANGNEISSGVYFYRLRAGNVVLSKKMVLLR